MSDRMTAEELAAIREMLAETSTDPERRLLAELDAVMRERDEATASMRNWMASYDVARREEAQAEQRGHERGLEDAARVVLRSIDGFSGGNRVAKEIRQLKDKAGKGSKENT